MKKDKKDKGIKKTIYLASDFDKKEKASFIATILGNLPVVVITTVFVWLFILAILLKSAFLFAILFSLIAAYLIVTGAYLSTSDNPMDLEMETDLKGTIDDLFFVERSVLSDTVSRKTSIWEGRWHNIQRELNTKDLRVETPYSPERLILAFSYFNRAHYMDFLEELQNACKIKAKLLLSEKLNEEEYNKMMSYDIWS